MPTQEVTLVLWTCVFCRARVLDEIPIFYVSLLLFFLKILLKYYIERVPIYGKPFLSELKVPTNRLFPKGSG